MMRMVRTSQSAAARLSPPEGRCALNLITRIAFQNQSFTHALPHVLLSAPPGVRHWSDQHASRG